jgi:hypothetical protein
MAEESLHTNERRWPVPTVTNNEFRINDYLTYSWVDSKDSIISLHLHRIDPTTPFLAKMKNIKEGIRLLQEVIKNDKSNFGRLKKLVVVSWIVTSYPELFERFGFNKEENSLLVEELIHNYSKSLPSGEVLPKHLSITPGVMSIGTDNFLSIDI